MQPTETVWTTSIGDHPGIIPVQFGQNPISGSEEILFKEIVDGRTDGRTHVRTDDGRRTMGQHKSSHWARCAQVS